MPALCALRGVAILGVLFLHGFFWRYRSLHFSRAARWMLTATQPGWLGVKLFLVLSGFLITGILVDSKTRPHFYKRFYGRRALRILPAYCLTVGLGNPRAGVYRVFRIELHLVSEHHEFVWSGARLWAIVVARS